MTAKAEEVLSDLVLLKSSSEDGLAPIINYVSERLKKLGLNLRHHGKNDSPAIVAEFHSGGVALCGHLDTVPHGTGWIHTDGDMIDGMLYGRGACDMKGGCTAMLLAAEDLVAAEVPFSLCFTTDEEITMAGADAASDDSALRNAPAILVAEPTNFDIIYKEKGQLEFSISTSGRACHSSMPQLGENAIAKMTALLHKLDDLQRLPRNPSEDMTLSVNTIKGGTRINVVPDGCEAEVDVRYPPSMNQAKVLAEVRRRLGKKGYSIKVLHDLNPVETDPKSPAIKILQDLIGPNARVSAVPYATEMVMFNKHNPSVLICGPGDARGCHIVDEKIEITQVVRAAELYTEYCARMASS